MWCMVRLEAGALGGEAEGGRVGAGAQTKSLGLQGSKAAKTGAEVGNLRQHVRSGLMHELSR